MWTTTALLATLSTAQAQDLVYQWDDQTSVRYHLQSQISTPKGFRVYGEVNVDARVLGLTTAIDTTCASKTLGKGWMLECAIDEVSLAGLGFESEQANLDQVLGEFQALLSSSVIQIEVRQDGHIRSVDLEGPPKDSKRQSYMHEQMRQIIRRTVSPLSVQMPKKGKDPGKEWKYRSGMHLGFELMSVFGTAGGTRYTYTIDTRTEDEVFIVGEGHGTIGTNLEMSGGGGSDSDGNIYGSSTNPSVSMIVVSQTRFDLSSGLLAYSELAANGQSTAQTMNVGGTARYNFGGWVGRIHEDGTIEGLEGRMEPEGESVEPVEPVEPEGEPVEEPVEPEGEPEGEPVEPEAAPEVEPEPVP
jgi:hypothetical protein